LLLLAGCGGKARPVGYENLTPKLGAVEFTHITVDLSRTRAELLVVLRRNNPGRRLSLPPIDYARQETYLVATGPRSSTGYALRIVRVEQKGDHIDVVVHEQTPALGDPVRARVTYPFLLLALNSHKPVHLRWPGRP
jgi:hypothetical protein